MRKGNRLQFLFSEKYFGAHHAFAGFDFQPEVFHGAVSFDSIAGAAKQLVIFVIITTPFRDWNDVVNFKIPNLKIFSTSVALTLLLFVQPLFDSG